MATRQSKKTTKKKASKTTKKKRRSLFHRGSEARGRVDDELAKGKARREARKQQSGKPWRFRMAPESEAQIVILDEQPDFFLYEHSMYDPGRNTRIDPVPCIGEYDTCAVCEEKGDEPTYCMFLSVIDLREFTRKDGTEEEFSRKLFVVKPRSQKKFLKRAARRSLRGQVVSLSRSDERSPVIGDDIEFEDEVYSEEDLAEFVREWTDREGKTHTEDCSVPYDYEEVFEAPTAEDLRALVGGKAPAGSAAEADEELEDDESEWEDEDGDADVPWDEDEDGEEEEDEAPRRRSRSKKISKKTSRRRAPPVDDDEGEEEEDPDEETEEEDDPPPRRNRPKPTVGKKTGTGPRRKVRRKL